MLNKDPFFVLTGKLNSLSIKLLPIRWLGSALFDSWKSSIDFLAKEWKDFRSSLLLKMVEGRGFPRTVNRSISNNNSSARFKYFTSSDFVSMISTPSPTTSNTDERFGQSVGKKRARIREGQQK